jgi:hypothetical protein
VHEHMSHESPAGRSTVARTAVVTPELHTWDATGPARHSARGVASSHQAARQALVEALAAMPPGKAEGRIQQAWIDWMADPQPEYRYGPVLAQARRDSAGKIHVKCDRCPARLVSQEAR